MNICSIINKIGEFVSLAQAKDIHVIMCQESWLDASTPNCLIPGFMQLSRRDRSEKANRGGVIVYVRSDVNNAVALFDAPHAERSWHLIQRDSGSIAICNWYLPPNAPMSELESIDAEICRVQELADVVIVSGDLNIHHKSWLKYSREDTPKGRRLKEILDCHGIKQMVRNPTRGNYLLDLICSSHSDLKVHVGPQIADHATVIATLPDSLETRHFAPRRIWHFKDANWEAMKDAILKFDCSRLLEGSVDVSLDVFEVVGWFLCVGCFLQMVYEEV